MDLGAPLAGERNSKEKRAWWALRDRCLNPKNPKFNDYGGRGIEVCDRWLNSYAAFLQDMGRAPGPEFSIDRKDNDGNYDPGNCRWATRSQQMENRRRGGGHVFTHAEAVAAGRVGGLAKAARRAS